MEEKLLRAFVTVAEVGTVSGAAIRLDLVQSALSRQLQRLQRELRLPLFARVAGRFELTTAGEAFLPVAREVLVAHRRAEQAARALASGRLTDVAVAAPGTTLIDVVLPFVATFGEEDPRPRVAETQLDDSLLDAVARHDLVVMPTVPPPSVASLPLMDLPVWAYVAPGPRSRELAERQKRAVPAGVATTMPVYAARAAGGILEDVDGNRLIDLASGIAVTSVGASHPRVVAAVQEQVAQFTHTSFMITPYEGYVAVAEQLDRTSPIPGETRTALFNSGAEAVENAVKVARAYTGKQAVAAFDHAYHGRTTLTMALTAKSMPYKHSFGPFAPEIYRVPGSYPLRDGLSGAEAAQRAISALEKQIGADNLAAVIMEPIQGEGGFIVPAEGFLPAVVEWCKANDVLFIADEVQSGIARTGAWFASETEGIEPDLMATAKGIAGGMPLSGVTGRAEVMDSVHPGGLGGTYGGNPVATAAALAVFEAVEEDGLLEKARRIEQVIREHFAQNADDRIAEVRGRGAMMAIEFVGPATGEPDATLAATVAAAVRATGVILLTCGTYGNVVRFLPPLTIGEDLLKEGLSEVTKALQSA